MLLLSVDGGTTNTRLVLLRDGVILDGQRVSVGLRDQLKKDEPSYRETLAAGIRQLLEKNGLSEPDVDAVTVSGMICSERGLCEVPHVPAPVNPSSLAAAMRPMEFPEIARIPFYLIPGVKTGSSFDKLSEIDIMRGEETELYGILERLHLAGDVTLVLPGSHCKVIPVEKDGTLKTFATTVSGELIRAAAEHTILQDGIQGVFPKEIDGTFLSEGFDYAKKHGLTEALFKVRILQKFRGYSPEELYGVLCGAILSEDVQVIQANCRGKVLVGGSDPFRSALVLLLREKTDCDTAAIPEEIARYAVAYGAEKLMEERMK